MVLGLINKIRKSSFLFLFSTLLIVGILSGCQSSPQIGINELSTRQLEKKLDNHETFILFSFSANEKDIEKTKLIEAFNDSFRRSGVTAYYINLKDMSDKESRKLAQKYVHPKSGDEWNPLFSMSVVENGGVYPLNSKNMNSEEVQAFFKTEANNNVDHLQQISNIDQDVRKTLEYIQFYEINLTDQKELTK
ncbi:hypothetical protein [Pseudobacillus badius]|uniref:hypothetical protein n=1 Tax=Bacillus badius TaxID=1455 RepID=UPI0007B0786A|nr:hypothetical protein [Bacillus badius]KZO00924.1 hypothetical protein A4244_14515 [Bacillus badius]OCS88887.1 hypothetical protein A6M11_14535 [Bacillus badius]OVE47539.1 hypothetical protein B1A98_18410 [Bacillus badius]TDV99655.1 hypothetical protein B0G66_12115 [Bacillus badius]